VRSFLRADRSMSRKILSPLRHKESEQCDVGQAYYTEDRNVPLLDTGRLHHVVVVSLVRT
jgi:hypothetical protein